MIAAEVVEQVRQLLREGAMSQRKIARRVGVSRGTVGAIPRGRTVGRRPNVPPSHDYGFPHNGPVERCPGCGAMVHMPCLACRVRAIRQREGHRRPGGGRSA